MLLIADIDESEREAAREKVKAIVASFLESPALRVPK